MADFLDTNILVYAYDSTSPSKQATARGLLKSSSRGVITISAQVLAEFSNVMLHRMRPRAGAQQVLDALQSMGHLHIILPDEKLVVRAIEAHLRYGVHFYDGMIIAAAERGACTRIYSEDLNGGQEYFGIQVVNPFR